MKKTITALTALFFSLCLHAQQVPQAENKTAQFPAAASFFNTNLTYKIIAAPGKTYSYDIYADGRLMIH